MNKRIWFVFLLAIALMFSTGTVLAEASAVWTQLIPIESLSARLDHGMAYDSDRNIVVMWGGRPKTPIETFELEGNEWIQKNQNPANSPPALSTHAMVYDPIHQETVMYSVGTWVWKNSTWSERHPLNSPPVLSHPMMTFDELNNVVVLFGGENNGMWDQTWVWDGSNWQKKEPVHKPSPRYRGGMAYDSLRSRVVLFGGSTRSQSYNDTWEWDGNDWTLRSPSGGPAPREGLSLAYDKVRQKITLYGGGGFGECYDDQWEWDGFTGVWSRIITNKNPGKRYASKMVTNSQQNTIILFGGQDPYGKPLKDTWKWDGSAWDEIIPPSNPPAAQLASMAYDSTRNEAVVFGGEVWPGCCSISVSETWTWNSATGSWNRREPIVSPSPRAGHGMTYASNRDRTVLFGGYVNPNWPSEPFPNKTWEWDGSNWQGYDIVGSPSGRWGLSLIYDEGMGKILLFGGQSNQGYLNDTWTYDGSWHQLTPAHSPSPRYGSAIAYDRTSGDVILFGGATSDGGYSNETWIWNDSDWIQKTPASSPPSSVWTRMACDNLREVCVLVGSGAHGTWEWNGENWNFILGESWDNPGGRGGPSIVYDSHRQSIILYSGNMLDDLWEYRDPLPPNSPPTVSIIDIVPPLEGDTPTLFAVGNDPDGDPLSYFWDMDGDGIFETAGQSVIFSATDGPNDNTIAVQVVDTGGLSSTDQTIIHTENVSPTAVLSNDGPANEIGPVTISFSEQSDFSTVDTAVGFHYAFACDGNVLSLPVSYDQGGTDHSVSCIFNNSGSYTVTGRIFDKDNGFNTYPTIVVIQNEPPIVSLPTINPEPSILNGDVLAWAIFSDSEENDGPFTCTIDYGDGSGPQAGTISSNVCNGPVHTYTHVGEYSVTVAVTDKDQETGRNSATHKVIYRFDGFLKPIDDYTRPICQGCTISIFKGGATVPVKLQIKDAFGNVVQAEQAPVWLAPQQGGPTNDPINEIDFTDPATSGTSFVWDSDGQQYRYNWKTKDFATGYYWRIGVMLDDGQIYYVYIGLR